MLRFCDGIAQMDVLAGVGYAVVVEGFNGNFGTFDIAITAEQARLCRRPPRS